MKNFWAISRIVAINCLVFVLLLAILEGGARLMGLDANRAGGIFGAKFAPYVMWANQTSYLKQRKGSIPDLFRNESVHFSRSTNNWGFRADQNFDWAAEYPKAVNEKVVLLTGGSATAGAGATSDDQTIDAHMQKVLNTHQDRYQYKVINFANGGWVVFQEYIGLVLWGKSFDPDWIVTMDGRNDIAVACSSSQGDGYPDHYHHMRSYVEGYMPHARPDFYRGWLENELIHISALYRWITGKQYVRKNQRVSTKTAVPQVATRTTWKDVERQVVFYVRTEDSILNISDSAKYILSLQPLIHSWKYFDGEGEMNPSVLADKFKGKECGLSTYQQGGIFYFYQRAEEETRKLAEKYRNRKDVLTFNTHFLFPEDVEDRKPFFLDEAHLHDIGQEILGTFYAFQILKQDFPDRATEYQVLMDRKIRSLIDRGLEGGTSQAP